MKGTERPQNAAGRCREGNAGLFTGRRNGEHPDTCVLEAGRQRTENQPRNCAGEAYRIENVTELFFDDPAEAALTSEGRELLGKYRELLLESPRYTRKKPRPKPVRQLPLYDLPVSAGTGDFLDSDRYEMIDAPDDVPLCADFALTISGNSMVPALENGQMVWIHQQNTLEPGEIGIFSLNGQAFCKELVQDEKGVFLYFHNPKYRPIWISEYDELFVFGKVVG